MTPDLVWVLQERRDQIVATFVAEVVRTDLSPPGVGRMLLVDHIPRFLDEIVAELAQVRSVRFSHDAVDTSATARRHGEQRWSLGYDLEALVREYGILRHAILHTAREAGAQPTIEEFDVLAKCLSVGMAEAATEYVKFRDEQFDRQRSTLVFLAEAGQILSSSLDYRSTIGTLTSLLVPRMADWCVVHLEGSDEQAMPIAHVDGTKVAALREALRACSFPGEGPDVFPEDARIGEPELVRRVDPHATSWLSVPLRVQGHTFGALTLVYVDSGRHYEESDLLLAQDLARRAAVAIDNARLYDLSQKERSRVEAATRAKDEFVAMISHELRTPLNAILGWLRLMRAGSLDEAKREHAFDVIERNAEAQAQLVSDLLDISRIITGKMRLNPAQVDLGNVIEMAVEGVRPAAEAKQITLDVAVTSVLVRGDGERLQQVAWNLLTNAVKFTPKHGHVTVRLRRVESDVELCVEDDGEGIDPSFLPHVFDSFRQSDGGSARAHGGLGIGLSIVKHLVELHGGSISALSVGRGYGSTFVCRLPVSPLLSSTLGVSRPATTKTPAASRLLPRGLEGIRVLVVDDEPDARELIAHVLTSCGMDVRVANSAADALDELGRFTPHVILSDIGMPEEDGYALVRSVRTHQDETKRGVPVIALTAFARNDDRTRALVEGFNLHLSKPVEPMELVRAVIDLSGSVVGSGSQD